MIHSEEAGDRGPRRLVLLPREQDQSSPDEEWELVDPWAATVATATATTRRVGELVVLVDVAVSAQAPSEVTRCLVQQLVAALRRTSASLVVSSPVEEVVRRELIAIGFVPLPPEAAEATRLSGRGNRLILQL